MSIFPDRAGRGAMVGWRRLALAENLRAVPAGSRRVGGGGAGEGNTQGLILGNPGLQSPDVEAGDTEMLVGGVEDIHLVWLCPIQTVASFPVTTSL